MKKICISLTLLIGVLLGTLSFSVPIYAHEEESVYPEVLSNAVLVGDYDEERILYMETNTESETLCPASTTQVMTALLIVEAIERGDIALDEVLTVGAEIESIDYRKDSNAKLVVGEEITVNDLLGVMLVQSACEAANVLAVRLAGSVREFVYLMNNRANELGMKDTFYKNPHGLYEKEHVTTLTDLYVLFRAASSHELLMMYLSASRWDVLQTNKSKARSYTNHAWVLDTKNASYCAYAVGGKSGYAEEGSALVLLGEVPDEHAENGVHRVIVVLGNTDLLTYSKAFVRMYYDTKVLLEWTSSHFSTQKLVSSETALGSLSVKNASIEKLDFYVSEECWYYMPNSYYEGALTSLVMTEPVLEAPVEAGQKVGTYILKYNGNIIFRANIEVREAAEALVPNPLLNAWQGALVGLLIVALLGLIVILIIKKR